MDEDGCEEQLQTLMEKDKTAAQDFNNYLKYGMIFDKQSSRAIGIRPMQ